MTTTAPDAINPTHYRRPPAGLTGECIDFSQHLDFVRGNAFKYAWRAGHKDDPAQELTKALWYVRRDITHGDETEIHRPGHLTVKLHQGPMTLRRRILADIWNRHDLTRTLDLIASAIEDPARLDQEH